MGRRPPQANRRPIHFSNLKPDEVYVITSSFGEAEVSVLPDEDMGSVRMLIHAGYLRNGNSRKGPKEEFCCPADKVVFFEMVKAG